MEKLSKVIGTIVPFSYKTSTYTRVLDNCTLSDHDQYYNICHMDENEVVQSILEYLCIMLLNYHVLEIPTGSMFRLICHPKNRNRLLKGLNSEKLKEYTVQRDGVISLKFTWDNLQKAQEVAGFIDTQKGFIIPDEPGWLTVSDEAKELIDANGVEKVAEFLATEFVATHMVDKTKN